MANLEKRLERLEAMRRPPRSDRPTTDYTKLSDDELEEQALEIGVLRFRLLINGHKLPLEIIEQVQQFVAVMPLATAVLAVWEQMNGHELTAKQTAAIEQAKIVAKDYFRRQARGVRPFVCIP